MASQMPTDTRFASRVGPDLVRATVSGESGRAVADVLELSLTGAVVHFSLARRPTFFVGERVALDVRCETGPVLVFATVRSRVELDGCRRFDLAFGGRPKGGVSLHRELFLINRRKATHVEPGAPVPVDLQTLDRVVRTTGRMRDVSANGIAVVLDPPVEKALSCVLEADVTFMLPGQDQASRFRGWIRNRHQLDDEDSVCIGLCFDPKSSPDFVSQQRDIHNYVVARHATLLLQNRVSPREGSVRAGTEDSGPGRA